MAKKSTKKATKSSSRKKETTVEKTAADNSKETTDKKVESGISEEEKKKLEEEKKIEEEKKKKEEEEKKIASYRKAGEIATKVKDEMRPKIKPGAKLLDLIDEAENKIVEFGGKPGFPVNISINNVAAHYTSPPGDKNEIKEGDIVKFDLGVHIDGYSVDTAFTVSFNDDPSLQNLVKAAEDGVDTAIKMIKPGVMTNELGAAIEKTVRGYGYKPIKDLMGHRLEQWDIHSGKSIPCIALPKGEKIEEGEVFAVEVFASNGEGTVHAQNNAYIFALNPGTKRIPLRSKPAKQILGYIVKEFQTLPFSKFQIYKAFPRKFLGLLEIIKTKRLIEHNVLAERKEFYVAQSEHTILVTKDGCETLT